jgi:hypothetical protein
MKKLSLVLFVAHLIVTITLTSFGKYSFGIADAIVSVALLAFNAYQLYLAKLELPDIRAEVEKAFAARDEQIRQMKNDMAKFNVVRSAVNDAAGFKF